MPDLSLTDAPAPARRLWLVTRAYAPEEGGVQTYAHQAAIGYHALGWQVTLFAKSSAGPRDMLILPGLRLVDVGPGPLLTVYRQLFGVMRRAWSAGERPAMIHACTWRAALPALPFRRPLVITVHGRELGRPRGWAGRLMRFVLGRATRIVAVSETTAGVLRARMPALASRCVVAWNGATTVAAPAATAFQRGTAGAQVLTVCRLVPRKNIRAAVVAAAHCRDRGARFQYRIAGRGPGSAVIRQEIQARALGDHVERLGFVDAEALAELYRSADIFLHPQIALEDGDEIEGFGITVADAMMQGLACIVGRDGGPAELVEHGVTGLIVDGGSVEAIAAALDLLLGDAALRSRLGAAARAWAETHLSWRSHCLASQSGAVAAGQGLAVAG